MIGRLGMRAPGACVAFAFCACVLVQESALAFSLSAPSGPITAGAVVLTPAPPSLERNAFESDSTIALIEERTDLTLPAAVTLDVDGTPGVYHLQPDLTGGVLAAGTVVDVHLLHFDRVGMPATPARVSGSVEFPRTIVGMIFRTPGLNETDVYGALGTTYPTINDGANRGFEFGQLGMGVSDAATISADRRTLTLDWGATGFADELRVFTAVPEPITAPLLGVGMFVAIGIARSAAARRRAW